MFKVGLRKINLFVVLLLIVGCGNSFDPSHKSMLSQGETNNSIDDEEDTVGEGIPIEDGPGTDPLPDDPALVQKPQYALDLSTPVNDSFLIAAKNAGVTTIIRYYDHVNETIKGKTIRAHELPLLAKHNLKLAVVFQHSNNKITSFTAARGSADAKRSLDLAKIIRQPKGSTIYFGVDGSWITTEDINKIRAYFKTAAPLVRAAQFQMGAYGSGKTCRILLAEDLADFCWLANAKGWPEYYTFFNTNQWVMQQRLPQKFAGLNVDFNLINPLIPEFGQFTVVP